MTVSTDTITPSRPLRASSSSAELSALQMGMGWLPEHGPNGLDRMFFGLVRHLPDAGVQVHGRVTGTGTVAATSGGQVQAFAEPSAPLLRRLWAARRSVTGANVLSRFDLVASHFALYTAPLLDLLADHPLVVHFHGPWASESAAEGASAVTVRLKRWIERMVYRRGDRFIVLSRAFRDVLTTKYGVDPARIHVVPGGVDVDRFAPSTCRREAREELGIPTDRPVVVSVRRLVRRVGLEPLIRGVDTLRRSEPDVLLLIAGRGPLAPALEHLIRERDLTRHVRLLGFVPEDDLPLLYRAADVSIVPSIAWEGFGLIAAESLAAGTPVLVTPVGGLPEVVTPLSDALVLDDSTPEALANGLHGALRGTRPLPAGERCRQYARDQFAWPVIARQTRTVYREVCS